MKINRVVRFVSALLILVLCSIAHATPAKSGTYTFEEVPDAEAQKIAPISQEFWNQYASTGVSQVQSLDVGTIIIGTIALDAIVNIGKSVWSLIVAGIPKIDLNLNVASAVPQGISHWTELDSWNDPIAKLYRTQLYTASKKNLGDVYYRLVFTYGGRYKGVGNYLTNVTVVPAQVRVPYRRNFYAENKVTELVNHGTKSNPIAGMSMLLTWGVESLTGKSMQSITLHVRGDGKIAVLPTQDDQPETINAPVRKAPRP